MGVRADELTQAGGTTTDTITTVQWLPSCQLLASRVCAPTLLSVGLAAVEATQAVVAATGATGAEAEAQQEAALLALHAATSEPGRKLLAASLAALRCAAAHPTNASAVADCGRAAIAASPSAAAALVGALGPPPCAGLAATPSACAAAPGCRVVPHGDHSDCEPAATYTALYLTANSTSTAATTTMSTASAASATAAREPTALAAAVQRLADSCASLLPPPADDAAAGSASASGAVALACGRAELRGAVVGPEQLEALELVAEGEHHIHEGEEAGDEEGHDHEGEGQGGAVKEGAADGHAHDDDDHAHEDELHHSQADDAQNLRIASVFIVLTAALLGCTLPWVMRGWAERHPLLGASLRCMSAGVILCLALVHVSTHAIEEMSGLLPLPYAGDLAGLLGLLDLGGLAAGVAAEEAEHHAAELESGHSAHQHPFPIGMCCVMFGFLLMAGAEMLVHAAIEARADKAAAAAAERMYAAEKQKQAAVAGEAADGAKLAAVPDVEAAGAGVAGGGGGMLRHQATSNSAQLGGDGGCDMRLDVLAVGGVAPACSSSGPPVGLVVVGTPARLAGLAALFELGCVFHSFIIGLSLGVLTQRGEVAAMLVALCIHQFAEGISLVSILMAAGLAGWRLAGMAAAYSVMAPAGIAVGIAVSDTYNGESVTARAVQGTINGVSGGVLLYLAAVMITAELAPSATTAGGMAAPAAAAGSSCCGAPPPRRWRGWERALLFAIVCVSAGAFAVLAQWA
eukprot:XP_001700327.1 zinc-nutrition responsive transporter [Chlamydomonas reinhardtii]